MTKISSLTEISSGVDVDADFLAIVDTSATTTKKVKPKKMLNGFGVTKGNILSTDGTDFGVLGVGSNNQVLTADSSQTYGVKWSTPESGGASGDMVYPLNVTIGDYTSPNAATASSTATPTATNDFTFSSSTGWTTTDATNWNVDTANTEIDFSVEGGNSALDRIYYDLGAGNVSDTAWVLRLHQVNFATQATYTNLGFALSSTTTDFDAAQDTLGCWLSDGGDANDYFYAAMGDGAAPTNSGNTMSGNFATGTDYYIELIRVSATSFTATIKTGSFSGTTIASFSVTPAATIAGLRYIKFWETGPDVPTGVKATGTIQRVEFFNGITSVPNYSAANTYDTSTSTYWKSNSEANPSIYFDLSGSVRDIASIALNIDKTNTSETQIKIRCSTDTTFTSGETVRTLNISDFTDDTWRFITINRLAADCRYVQVYGSSGSTATLALNEVKVYYSPTTTDWNRKHFHKYLDPTSATATSLDSN